MWQISNRATARSRPTSWFSTLISGRVPQEALGNALYRRAMEKPSKGSVETLVLLSNMRGVLSRFMSSKADVWQGTLALMVLKTLEHAGSLHGYGIARQIEQTSADLLSVNYGTLYPALLKLEQEGYITSEWGLSDNNRKAKFYQLTRAGRKQIEKETQEWEQMAAILARFLNPNVA